MLTGLEPPPDHPQFWSCKKITAWFLGILTVFIAALLLYDEKLEPWDDLKPTHTEVPDIQKNGYLILKEAWENLPADDYKLSRQWDDFQNGMVPWDDSLVDQLNASRRDLQSDLSKARAAPDWVVPFKSPGLSLYEKNFYPLGQIRSLEAGAWRQLKAGDSSGVLGLIRDLRSLSKRQIKGANHTAALGLGFFFDMRAALLTGNLLEELPPQESVLRQLALIWSDDQLTPDDLLKPAAGESDWLTAYWRSGQYVEDFGADNFFRKILTRSLTNPNATENHLHRVLRILRTKGLNTSPSFQTSVFAELDRLRPAKHGAAAYLNANFAGLSIAQQLIYFTENGYVLYSRLHLFQARAMRIAIAIKMWHLNNGGVAPPALTTLVPEYLQAIPSDPWDGSTMLLDAATQIIYAVGQDWKPDLPGFRGSRRNWIDSIPESPGLRLVRPPYVVPSVPALRKSTKPSPKSAPPAGKPTTVP